MKGTFRITSHYLKEIEACNQGLAAFEKAYPDGGEYQELLDRCCAEGHSGWAMWLLSKVGATEDVRIYDEFVSDEKLEIVFAGKIEFKIGATIRRLIAGTGIKAGTGIEAGTSIKAGRGIEAGTSIKAGWGIEAGKGIIAGEGIEAGWGIIAGWGIEAGTSIEAGWGIIAGRGIEAGEGIKWWHYAKVRAKSKPENLISGYWEQLPEGESK